MEPEQAASMEEDGIDMVLGRATELRLKISNCIHKATITSSLGQDPSAGTGNGAANDRGSGSQTLVGDTEDDEEVERLLNICDALESLETQLSSLQVFSQLGLSSYTFLDLRVADLVLLLINNVMLFELFLLYHITITLIWVSFFFSSFPYFF